jgi:hypothetical protein
VTLATILLKLWKLRLWVGVGLLVGIGAAAASSKFQHSTVYASASTQMLVDSPASALANSQANLAGYAARADVYASLMTSDEALAYIGRAAGVPGDLIQATGPAEVDGSPSASHAAVQSPAKYKLTFAQNPDLPTVDVYAAAPTTAQAISLANGAVAGLGEFVQHLDNTGITAKKRIQIRQLGGATGAIVDPGASKKIAVLVFLVVSLLWCGLVLFFSRLRADLRVARYRESDDFFAVAEPDGFNLGPAGPFVVPEDELLGIGGHVAGGHAANRPALDTGSTASSQTGSPDDGDNQDGQGSGRRDSELGDPRDDSLHDEVGFRR